MFTMWLIAGGILRLVTSLVLIWACILLRKRTRHWPFIVFFIAITLPLLNSLLLDIYRNIVLWKATVEEVETFHKNFSEFQFNISSLVGTVSFALALIAGIGIIKIYSKCKSHSLTTN